MQFVSADNPVFINSLYLHKHAEVSYSINVKFYIIYKIDFSFLEKGRLIYSEAKGFETDRWRICVKLWKYYGPAPLEIWKGSYSAPRRIDYIVPVK